MPTEKDCQEIRKRRAMATCVVASNHIERLADEFPVAYGAVEDALRRIKDVAKVIYPEFFEEEVEVTPEQRIRDEAALKEIDAWISALRL